MRYELIALDLDDSLLGKDSKISHKNKEAIYRAQMAGLMITLATGRMIYSALPFAKELSLSIPIITYNGGIISKPDTGGVLYHMPLTVNTAIDVIRIAKELKIHINVYIDDKVFVEEIGEYASEYSKAFGVKLNISDDILKILTTDKPPTKILAISKPDKIQRLKQRLIPFFDNLCAQTSKPFFLELTNPQATKGKALKLLTKNLAISPERIIAIGDGFNDISMIKYAGLGVAMGNAPDDVKNASDYVTSSNTEDGIAEVIYKFVLK